MTLAIVTFDLLGMRSRGERRPRHRAHQPDSRPSRRSRRGDECGIPWDDASGLYGNPDAGGESTAAALLHEWLRLLYTGLSSRAAAPTALHACRNDQELAAGRATR